MRKKREFTPEKILATPGSRRQSDTHHASTYWLRTLVTRSSSGDEITNVNFLYDDIVHVLQNTMHSRINSATGRRSSSQDIGLSQCLLKRKYNKERVPKWPVAALYPLRPRTWQDFICCCCSEITQCNGYYAVQGHSRSPILVPIESSYAPSY